MDKEKVINELGKLQDYLNDAKSVVDNTSVEDNFIAVIDEVIEAIEK